MNRTLKQCRFMGSSTKIIRRGRPLKQAPVESPQENSTNDSQEKTVLENPEQSQSDQLRLNEIKVQMLSKNLFRQLFLSVNPAEPDMVRKCRQVLQQHNIDYEHGTILPDVDFKLPPLMGKNILEHFYNLGESQSKPYRDLIEKLVDCDIPPMPKKWVLKEGWHRYDKNGKATPVQFPDEEALIFDVEVCMTVGTNPTLACAVSSNYWYSWVSSALIDESIQQIETANCDLEELIPLESHKDARGYDLGFDLLKPKIIVGHNVSYDRARIKEQYWIEKTGTRFLDTMAMHVCVSGVTSYQRAILKSKKQSQEDENWLIYSSLNSLSEVYKLYCGKQISKDPRNIFVEGSLKDVKQNFQELTLYCANDVLATVSVLKALYPLFKERFPHPVTLSGMLELSTAYLPVNSNWTEYINSADLTYEDVELESKFMLAKKADKACELFHSDAYTKDLWMWDQDWSTQPLKLKKPIVRKIKKKKPGEEIQPETEPIVDEDLSIENYGYFDHNGMFCLTKDESDEPFLEKFGHLFDKKQSLPARKPLLPGYPAWYRKLCTKPQEEDWIPGAQNISTGMQVTPKLLSLSWEGYPLHFIRGEGWGFLVPFTNEKPNDVAKDDESPEVPFETLIQSCPIVDCDNLSANSEQSQDVLNTLWKDVESKISKKEYYTKKKKEEGKEKKYTGSGVKSNIIFSGCCCFMKLPHKDGVSKKVGNPLAKDFINKFSENVLTGIGAETEKVLTSARMLSYWRNNRDRIKQQKVMWLSENDLPVCLKNRNYKYGAILPQVVVCGTLTRRATEPTWLTASNIHKERIGSELRGMVLTPPGYNFVGADVDSQELWIAAVLGDSQFGIHGATPFGWMTLSGSKATGTDMHSHTAKAVKITRDHAKVINYARIYGAGQNFAQQLLKQFNPAMSDGDAKVKAQKMFLSTKGKKTYKLKEEFIVKVFGDYPPHESELVMSGYQATRICKMFNIPLEEMYDRPKWSGGTESEMFNRLEEIAGSEVPKTPFLECRLTRALMTDDELRKRHLPTAINWVVQSGAVDFLHLMLVNMAWLTKNKARFCLSFHDEVRYMVPEKYKYQTALALHITNLYTRAFCAKKLGFNDLPQSVAFFSSVDVDTSFRKEASLDCVTPSNPHGLSQGYGVPLGESLDIVQTLEKTGGSLGELFNEEED